MPAAYVVWLYTMQCASGSRAVQVKPCLQHMGAWLALILLQVRAEKSSSALESSKCSQTSHINFLKIWVHKFLVWDNYDLFPWVFSCFNPLLFSCTLSKERQSGCLEDNLAADDKPARLRFSDLVFVKVDQNNYKYWDGHAVNLAGDDDEYVHATSLSCWALFSAAIIRLFNMNIFHVAFQAVLSFLLCL